MEIKDLNSAHLTESSNPIWKKIIVESTMPKELTPLREISRNLWWVWSPEARALFNEIDPEIWEECQHNPIILLEQTSLERFETLKSDESFVLRMKTVESQLRKYLKERFVNIEMMSYKFLNQD